MMKYRKKTIAFILRLRLAFQVLLVILKIIFTELNVLKADLHIFGFFLTTEKGHKLPH